MKKIIFYALVAGIIYYLLTTYRTGTEQATKEEEDLQAQAAAQKQKNTEMEQLANAVYTTLRSWSPPELSILDKASRLSVEDFRIFNQYFNNLWPQGIIHLIDKQGQSFTNKKAKKKGRYDVYMRLKNLVAQV